MDVIVLEPPDVEIMKFIGKSESLQAVLIYTIFKGNKKHNYCGPKGG